MASVVLGVVATGFWVRDTIRQQDADKAASAAGTTYPQPTACAMTDLETIVDMPVQVGVGAGLTAQVSLTNRGAQPCLVDVGGQSLGLVVVSGSATLLDSSVCPAEPASRRLLLGAGELAEVRVTWNGMVATSECAAVPRAGGNVAAGTQASSQGADGSQAAREAAGAPAPAGEQGAGRGGGAADQQSRQEDQPGQPSQNDQSSQGDQSGQGGGQQPASPASAAQTADAHPTEVTISPKGGYAQAGTYTLWLTLGGELIGTERPLLIGQG